MFFKLVARRENMQDDSDLIRSKLYSTDAPDEVIEKIIEILKMKEMYFYEKEEKLTSSLDVLGYSVDEVLTEKVFDVTANE